MNQDRGTYGQYGGNIFSPKMGVPSDQKDGVLTSLVTDIHSAGDHFDTGIFGTQSFFKILSENGLNELVNKVINQPTSLQEISPMPPVLTLLHMEMLQLSGKRKVINSLWISECQ